MPWGRVAQAVALLLNLAGAILIVLSFQATSSDFSFVTAPHFNLRTQQEGDGEAAAYAICIRDYMLAATDGKTGMMLGAANKCPTPQNAKPAAVVIADHPYLLTWGLMATIAGFFVQLIMSAGIPEIISYWRSRQ
jgi:hypothetical protein